MPLRELSAPPKGSLLGNNIGRLNYHAPLRLAFLLSWFALHVVHTCFHKISIILSLQWVVRLYGGARYRHAEGSRNTLFRPQKRHFHPCTVLCAAK